MKRDSLVPGLMLVLLGLSFLVFQLFPELWGSFSWPWILIGIGVAFAIGSLISRKGGLMIPAFILAGLGTIFIYQSNSGNWESWAYIWTLIPGIVGLGLLVGGLYDPELRGGRLGAFILIVVSAAIFTMFSGLFGTDITVLRFWPILVILAGVVIVVRTLLDSNQKSA